MAVRTASPFEWSSPFAGVERGPDGHIRSLQHGQDPFLTNGSTPPIDTVLAYLDAAAELLGIAEALPFLSQTVGSGGRNGPASNEPGLRLRWASAYKAREASVFLLQQTKAINALRAGALSKVGVNVEGSGLRIVVEALDDGRHAVRCLTSSLVDDQSINGPEEPIDVREQLTADIGAAVVRSFGFPPPANSFFAGVAAPVFLHRYRPSGRGLPSRATDAPPLVAGSYYPARSVRVPMQFADQRNGNPWELTAWLSGQWGDGVAAPGAPRAMPLRAIPLVTHAAAPDGRVFRFDPATARGDLVGLRPDASGPTLDTAAGEDVTLGNLVVPNAGMPWTLVGRRVAIKDRSAIKEAGSIGVAPPASPTASFKFGPRTNDFAAVNAYYHLETMLDLLDQFGLPLENFGVFAGTSEVNGVPVSYAYPLEVFHRAGLQPGSCGDGRCVNAQVVVNQRSQTTINQVIQFRFALADLQRNPGSAADPLEPLGIACDVRVVWHEFCHAMIAASTNYLEFGFAHSAGDALAAIWCDPASKLRDQPARFATYPWGTTPLRRHDRRAEAGWSWTSALGTEQGYHDDTRDPAGYIREQILSSTLFRLYRAMDGDAAGSSAPALAAAVGASEEAIYLIAAAIYRLGPAAILQSERARDFALLLQSADSSTAFSPTPRQRVGGTAGKAIAWAFERQGLPPLPTLAGASPADVYIRNARHGEYDHVDLWQDQGDGIWNRLAADGRVDRTDQAAAPGVANHLYVAVRNRGAGVAANVVVSVYVAQQGSDQTWLGASAWQGLPNVPPQSQTAVADELVFGPFAWTPAAGQAYAVLAAVDADGDRSNINPLTALPCALLPTPIEQLVRLDNNLAYRQLD